MSSINSSSQNYNQNIPFVLQRSYDMSENDKPRALLLNNLEKNVLGETIARLSETQINALQRKTKLSPVDECRSEAILKLSSLYIETLEKEKALLPNRLQVDSKAHGLLGVYTGNKMLAAIEKIQWLQKLEISPYDNELGQFTISGGSNLSQSEIGSILNSGVTYEGWYPKVMDLDQSGNWVIKLSQK